MKKLIILFVVLFSFNATAKFNRVPADSIWASPDVATYMEKQTMDRATGEGGTLTLDDYKNREMTKNEERRARKAQYEGGYQSPEEEFSAMDIDGDGFVTDLELRRYYIKKYDIDSPLTKNEERIREKKKRDGTYVDPQQKLAEIDKQLEEIKKAKEAEEAAK